MESLISAPRWFVTLPEVLPEMEGHTAVGTAELALAERKHLKHKMFPPSYPTLGGFHFRKEVWVCSVIPGGGRAWWLN